jgi:hypothetical protein
LPAFAAATAAHRDAAPHRGRLSGELNCRLYDGRGLVK